MVMVMVMLIIIVVLVLMIMVMMMTMVTVMVVAMVLVVMLFTGQCIDLEHIQSQGHTLALQWWCICVIEVLKWCYRGVRKM
jgi:hypothetical protein